MRNAKNKRLLRHALATIGIDLSHLDASPLKLAMPQSSRMLRIYLVGCGGTGSWLAPHLIRLARFLHEMRGMNVCLTLVDPDAVEKKNVFRQNFADAEIGASKGELLAMRYSAAWGHGVTVQTHTARFNRSMVQLEYGDLGVIVGCVDNPEARKEIAQVLTADTNKRGLARLPRLWWLDCGNGADTGQVLLGAARSARELRHAFPCTPEQGFCVNLPAPDLQHLELLDRQDAASRTPRAAQTLSCAELALTGDQSPSINSLVANVAASYLWRMFTDPKGLTTFATYCNLSFHSIRSRFITIDEVADTIGKTRTWFRRSDVRVDA